MFALENWQPGPEELQFLNVGTGVDLTIRELAEAVAAATGFQGEIYWDAANPMAPQETAGCEPAGCVGLAGEDSAGGRADPHGVAVSGQLSLQLARL